MSGTGGEVDSGMWKRITTVNRDRKDRNQINRRRKKKQKDIIDVSSFLSTMRNYFTKYFCRGADRGHPKLLHEMS